MNPKGKVQGDSLQEGEREKHVRLWGFSSVDQSLEEFGESFYGRKRLFRRGVIVNAAVVSVRRFCQYPSVLAVYRNAERWNVSIV